VVVAWGLDEITALEADGRLAPGWPLAADGPLAGGPVLADLEGDGDLDLAAIDTAGFVSLWDLGVPLPAASAGPWPAWGAETARSWRFDGSALPAPGAAALMEAASVVSYPHPVTTETRIRYRLGAPATVEVAVYDLAGVRRRAMAGPGLPGTENEVVVSAVTPDRLAPGVYVVRVSARGAAGESVAFRKVAVLP
jgi:hypothetical protein